MSVNNRQLKQAACSSKHQAAIGLLTLARLARTRAALKSAFAV
jgi:hypothetical protein